MIVKMDKYAVDLDKVLNDFEYSELTDQYVRPDSSQGQSYRVKGASATKHSINNVFHSLNEYLSSDVSDRCGVVTLNHNEANSRAEESKEDNQECEEVVSCESEEEAEGSDAAVENGVSTVLPLAESSTDLLVVEEEQIEEPVVEKMEEILEVQEVEGKHEDCPVIETSENIIETIIEAESESSENAVEKEEAAPIVGFNNPIELDESELNRYLDELEDELKVEEVPTEDLNLVETADSVAEEKEEGLKEVDENSVEVTVNLLAQEKIQQQQQHEDETEESKNSIISRPDSLQLPPDNVEQKKDINLIGEPGSTPYNNMYIAKQLDTTTAKEESDGEESTSSPSPTFSDISRDSSGSTTPSTETLNDDDDEPRKPEATPTETKTEEEHPERRERAEGEAGVAAQPVQEENAAAPAEQTNSPNSWLGKQAPLWIPDSEAPSCMHCDMRFTVIKRRHHCRACGLVLCSKCCYLRLRLEYLDAEARVCNRCHEILSGGESSSPGPRGAQPNPNNPMEYCSMVPPLQQAGGAGPPPTVMVPVGVLKRTGSSKKSNKSVMFCDGIRPGSDLTSLDSDFNYEGARAAKGNRSAPALDRESGSFIPAAASCLPPTVTFYKSDISYSECGNNSNVVEMLKNEILTFALQRNLYVQVKVINMDCCINKLAWCFSTDGLINVGQDEVVILLEFMEGEKTVPKDVFYHINNIYNDAVKGVTVKELGLSLHDHSNFLDSKNHAGFLYIRPTFQCLSKVIIPKEQYLIGILIHRWETPWAKIFPLRLILRLGAEYRYYPSPIISTRHRESVFVEIGHTIIKLLADFRNYSYTLQQIRGLTIHMEDKNTTVSIPVNRYDQVMKAINNSSDHILAFGACFSPKADSHLVCIQDVRGSGENSSYNTHAINIQNKPRKVTGASFIVFNGALKSSSGLTAKSSIVEDGLMIQIPPDHMDKIRESLKNMRDYAIQCGCVNAESDETVNIVWGEPDSNFNIGVESVIDGRSLSSVPSIRVHSGKDYPCSSGNHLVRWTEVFILQNCEENSKNQDAVNVSKISESIAKAVCQALVKYLDLLSSNNFHKIGIRTTLHVDNVSYCAGSNGMKLPPIYMKSLDNELVPVLHRITSNSLGESAVVLELIFRILNV